VTTRDDLLECAALVRAIRKGDLDRIAVPEAPLDILAQQIVAMCGRRRLEGRRIVPSRAPSLSVSPSCAHGLDEIVFLCPSSAAQHGHDLLRQNVKSCFGNGAWRSRSPLRMARTSAAHSSKSSRVVTKMRPLGTAPRQ